MLLELEDYDRIALNAALQTHIYGIIDTSPMVVANDATVFGSKSDGIVLPFPVATYHEARSERHRRAA